MVEVVLTAGGFAFLLSFASIFESLRDRISFFGCPLCTGFHLGYMVYFARGGVSIMDALLAAVVSSVIGLTFLVIFDR